MESNKRTIVKTITFKTATILGTIPFTGLGKAITIHILLTAIFYIHERIWNKIKWEKT